MAQIINGERIGQTAQLRTGCAAVVFDESQTRVLLMRRSDNGLWGLPGGGLEPGESVEEGCVREVWEETGLHVRLLRLIGVYSSPHRVIQYADGNRFQIIGLTFAAEVVSGELTLNEEATELAYFTLDEIAALPLMEHHRERLADALANQALPFIR